MKGAPSGLLLIGAKPEKEEDDDDKPDPKSGAISAAKALIKAVEAGDAEGVDEALRLHYDLCEDEVADDDE
jgi:DNA-binding GntR family transcriptional regulator